MTQAKSEALKASLKSYGQILIGHTGPRRVMPAQMLALGAKLRDETLWEMPILPGAVLIYQQLVAGREWEISGKERPVARAVEWINNVRTVDQSTGTITLGFEDFLQRRALDFLAVGRTAFLVKNDDVGTDIEYLDPTLLLWQRDRRRTLNTPVSPSEKIWRYYNDRYRADQVYIDHSIPIGGNGLFIAPLAFLLPTATLAWLIREHDSASTDGRRIRDIIITGNDQLTDALIDAIQMQVAIFSGQTVEAVGIPVVTMNNLSGTPVADQITTLGLSKIPDNFDRQKFIFDYVNQIAASTGLSLRHFWNEESTTNRALEEVQEQRQMQKGPSFFVRSEERLINASGILDRFGTGPRQVRFRFVEEVDVGSAKTNAEVLKMTAEALAQVAGVFGATLSLDALLAWMQSIRVLPNDLELVQSAEGGTEMPVAQNPEDNTADPSESTTAGDAPRTPSVGVRKSVPDYDEITMDMYGNVRERRFKVFSLVKHLAQQTQSVERIQPPDESEDEAFENALRAARQDNLQKLRSYRWGAGPTSAETAEAWHYFVGVWVKSQSLYAEEEVFKAVELAMAGQSLTEEQQSIIDLLAEGLHE